MKEQRWKDDDETIKQEFRHSLKEERMGMRGINASYDNNLDSMNHKRKFDEYQIQEHEPSWCTQLDTMGMQPHAREYLERKSTCMRSDRKFEMISGQMMDYSEGIQFSDTP